jgi:hypothetical protein
MLIPENLSRKEVFASNDEFSKFSNTSRLNVIEIK